MLRLAATNEKSRVCGKVTTVRRAQHSLPSGQRGYERRFLDMALLILGTQGDSSTLLNNPLLSAHFPSCRPSIPDRLAARADTTSTFNTVWRERSVDSQ